jgi:hypothetical protein
MQFLKKIFNWEKWNFDVIYAPIYHWWLYYGWKSKHFWFFTPSNPSLYFAGFEGCSKKEMLDQIPAWCRPTTLLIQPTDTTDYIQQQMLAVGLAFPVVVKPDTGMQGVLFRIVHNAEQLSIYHTHVGEPYVLQTYVDYPFEFSVFHIRYPNVTKGFTTGLIVKEYLTIVGNGVATLAELTAQNEYAKQRLEFMAIKHAANWNTILADGEIYYLNKGGNHALGARFANLNHEIDQQLTDVFDKISNEAGQFFYGRYDLKCTSLQDLKEGKNIVILEYNGAGAAVTHVFDRGMTYRQALKENVMHWRHLYNIAKYNHQHYGTRYWSFKEGWQHMQAAKKNFKKMQAADKKIVF